MPFSIRIRHFLPTLYRNRPYTTATHTNITASLFKSSISRRTLDKHHQSTYHLLDRERIRYDATKSKIYPSLDHLLVLIRKFDERNSNHIQLAPSLNTHEAKKAKTNYIEPLLFHCILSLYFISKSNYPKDFIDTQSDHLSTIEAQYGTPCQTIRESESHKSNDTSSSLEMVLSHFNLRGSGSSANSHVSETTINSTLCQTNLSRSIRLLEDLFSDYSLSGDILPWIQTVVSPSVSESCRSLTNLSNIPACILTDILVRTPMSKEEYYLQLQIWTEFQTSIVQSYKSRSKHLKTCLNNLVYYGVEYDSSKLQLLLTSTFREAHRSKDFLTKQYLNQIIWDLSYNNHRSQKLNKPPNTDMHITRAQESILRQLSKLYPEEKPHMNLNLKGYMGIILAIYKMSYEKAQKLFDIADQQHNPENGTVGEGGVTSVPQSDLILYHFTKISLSEAPDQLLYNFNSAAESFSHSSMVWLAFVNKLYEFGLLNEKRSLKILHQLLAKGDRILITKDLMLVLLKPVKSMYTIEHFIQSIESSGSPLLAVSHRSSLLPKYLRILYRSVKDSGNKEKPKYIPQIIAKEIPESSSSLPRIEYCRQLYNSSTLFKHKTSSTVAAMLSGEGSVSPETLYDLYQKELSFNNVQPNEECISALITASMYQVGGKGSTNREKEGALSRDTCLMWGDMYAPQVATHEFIKHVMTQPYQAAEFDESTKIFPTDHLWSKYISMLSKFQYVSELSRIIEWWESIEFVPDSNTLLELLVALPDGFGERHIQHYQKSSISKPSEVNSREKAVSLPDWGTSTLDWPWPSMEELEEARQVKANSRR